LHSRHAIHKNPERALLLVGIDDDPELLERRMRANTTEMAERDTWLAPQTYPSQRQ